MIGGGVLGVEAAAALARRGMRVSLLHRGTHLMDQQLDEHAGKLLHEGLSLRGINVILQAETVSFSADAAGNVSRVNLNDGRGIAAERVVLSVGVRPNIALAQRSGLPCDRGILVNPQLQTADPHISAIGECCQWGELTFGLVAPCWQQAETLASRLAGGDKATSFEVQNVPLRLKVTGLNLFCAGELHSRDGAQTHTTFDPFDGHYRRLVLCDNQLKGVLLWGDISDGPQYLQRIGTPAGQPLPFSVFSPGNEPDASGLQPVKSEPLPVEVARSHSMSKPVLVMAGHGMVGHHFLEQLVARELHLQYQVIVFAEEASPAYDRVHLSEYFSGRTAESLSMVEKGFSNRPGLNCVWGTASGSLIQNTVLWSITRDGRRLTMYWCWQQDPIRLCRRSLAMMRRAAWFTARLTILRPFRPARQTAKRAWLSAGDYWGWRRPTR